MDLVKKKCKPCEGGMKPLTKSQYTPLLKQIDEKWRVVHKNKLVRKFVFKDFMKAIDFINEVAKLSESEGHHPNIYLYSYKRVEISLTTHAIGGLSENDFILAAKIDELTK